MRLILSALFLLSCQFLSITGIPGYAVLVAGSMKWIRYRHQANVCNMYQILRSNGFPKDKIITFMYDDIANNTLNPTPNVIINEPNGPNLYHDIEIDYKGKEVNKENLFKVLTGDTSTGKKVIQGGKTLNVFLYYTGLGDEDAEFTMSHPTEGYIHAKEFVDVLQQMYKVNPFYRMFIAFEASHSGLIFEELLPTKMKVIALTAGATDEDTHGVFCDDTKYNTCLAGLFSYHFSQFLTKNDLTKATIFDLYSHVRHATKLHHPQLYGQVEAGHMPLRAFFRSKPHSGDVYSAENQMEDDFEEMEMPKSYLLDGTSLDNVKHLN